MNVGAFQYLREFETPEVAHEIYHCQSAHDQYGLRTALGVLDSLAASPDMHHQYDAGWQAIDLAEIAHGQERIQFIGTAHRLWSTVARQRKSRRQGLEAAYADTFTPVYEAGEQGDYDRLELRNRLATLLGKVATAYQRTDGPEYLGLANEVATAYLFARLSYKTGGKSPIAWPAKSWEDRHHGDGEDLTHENFDMHVGHYPFSYRKIQIKSFLDQEIHRGSRVTADGDRLLARWRNRYRTDIALVFGDVHLGILRGRQKDMLQMFLDTDRYGRIINIATNNILHELSDDTLDLTAFDRRVTRAG